MRPTLILLLFLACATAAHAYPAYDGPVSDTGGAFNRGQVAGLQNDLRDLEEALALRGIILGLPGQGTWDLQGYAERTLAEWQAQGVIGDRTFLLLLVPSQNRMALVFDASLQKTLDPWTAAQLAARVAVQAEEGQLYLASQSLITHLKQAPELQPKTIFGPGNRWPWIVGGMLILIATSFRGIRRWYRTRQQPA